MTQTALAPWAKSAMSAFYEKGRSLSSSACLETYLSYAPRGFQSFVTAMPVWLKEKLFLQVDPLRKELAAGVSGARSRNCRRCCSPNTNQSHAASAFPFRKPPTIGQRCSAWTAWASGQRRSAWARGTIKFLTPLWQNQVSSLRSVCSTSAFTYFNGYSE